MVGDDGAFLVVELGPDCAAIGREGGGKVFQLRGGGDYNTNVVCESIGVDDCGDAGERVEENVGDGNEE